MGKKDGVKTVGPAKVTVKNGRSLWAFGAVTYAFDGQVLSCCPYGADEWAELATMPKLLAAVWFTLGLHQSEDQFRVKEDEVAGGTVDLGPGTESDPLA